MRLIDADALNLDYEVEMADDWKTAHEIANCVKYAPTIDAAPVKHGEWKYSENVYDESTWICSICKEPWTLIDGTPQENGMKYCPSCGAKMEGEVE